MRAVAGQPAETVVSAVHGAVDAFRGPAPHGDDATVIVVRVPSADLLIPGAESIAGGSSVR